MFFYQEVDHNNLITNTRGLELEKPKSKEEGVTLELEASEILQKHFVYTILGKPGSGKSYLISEILNRKKFYGNKFNRIIYITPTEFKGILHDKFNTIKTLNIEWIYNHINEAQKWGCKNMLIVLDDVISQIPKSHPNPLQELFYNRRHLLKNGTISILFTTQKYTTTPKWLRDCSTGVFVFSTMNTESEMVVKENVAKKEKKYYIEKISNLEKHKFLFINMENNGIFNYQFNEI